VADPGQQIDDLRQIPRTLDDELDLVLRIPPEQGPKNVWIRALAAMVLGESAGRIRVRGLRRHRQQIARELRRRGSRRLHRHVQPRIAQPAGQITDLTLDQRLTARDHHMLSAGRQRLGHDLGRGAPRPFRLPGRVRRVAPPAPEVAARGADEERPHSGQHALALEAEKGLGDVHRRGE
jgi:hypothetical protein